MKRMTMIHDNSGHSYTWRAERLPQHSGYLITEFDGNQRFIDGSWPVVFDRLQNVVLPNYGLRLIGVAQTKDEEFPF